jgi:alkylated DNA repair dioxygenase AlkB
MLQPDLFGSASHLPEGFRYVENLVSPDEESALIAHFADLPFKEFEFIAGYRGKRRVVSFGWRYDFNERNLQKADDFPAFLIGLRQKAAKLAELAPSALQQVLITEYAPGAGIGWHKDRPIFGKVVGVSLLFPCRFRMRRKSGDHWERATLIVAPRSGYLLSGVARNEWEHSIPPLEKLRYSVTFRNFKDANNGSGSSQ